MSLMRFTYRVATGLVSASVKICTRPWASDPLSSAALVLRRTCPVDPAPDHGGRTRIWVQAVSVGEAMLGRRFAAFLLERFQTETVILTSSTPAGQKLLCETQTSDRFYTGPFPFDDGTSVTRALDSYRPEALVLLETELWPTLIEQTAERGVPIIVMNGRMSARSEQYYKHCGSFMRRTLGFVDLYCVQTSETADRLRRLGVDDARIAITGCMKHDAITPSVSESQTELLLDEMGIAGHEGRVIVAGSTRSGEEDVLLTAFKKLRTEFAELRLVLAPRHLRRLAEIKKIVEKHDLSWRCRSEGTQGDRDAPVVILDTMGELGKVYSCADVAFVGGALFPGPGGHNPLEPAALGKPVLFGPYMDNCRDAAKTIEVAGGAHTVSDADELAETLHGMFGDEKERAETGQRAKQVATEGQGATERNIELLAKYINADP